ncbi:cupin domain-containing protein [Sphingomonas sp. LaA6.9]|uniref:cupin domain-containing protein n=1 Tax=Sphingomonas sp. LaA6.9 TaxID=2919914 RepID=UPI001F4F8A07|nr:cupin domain-containing protein [Sphingomonas sp. LaA6.9]MCJ8156450.1 cupin domain-containing protein [Sphingomonas sp. LaA6.9]
MDDARALIDRLGLQPHPEGGWYRETWRAEAPFGTRAAGTAILFLLEAGQRSHWHRVDAEELWFWHAGAPLTLAIAPADSGPVSALRLGPDVMRDENPQARVPTGQWQAAQADGGWTLVSCVVVPGFEFSGFRLAPRSWEPGQA